MSHDPLIELGTLGPDKRSPGGFRRPKPAMSCLISASVKPTLLASRRTRIEDQWVEICVIEPTTPKIAICRPLF